MPADGRRKLVLVGVRTAIKAATGVDYFYDWSPAGVCELGRDSIDVLLGRPGTVTARIREGLDSHDPRTGIDVTANLTVLVDVIVRATPQVEKLNDAVADLTLAIGKAPSAGGTCTSLLVDSVDPPVYDVDASRGPFAVTTMRLAATYDYVRGVDR